MQKARDYVEYWEEMEARSPGLNFTDDGAEQFVSQYTERFQTAKRIVSAPSITKDSTHQISERRVCGK